MRIVRHVLLLFGAVGNRARHGDLVWALLVVAGRVSRVLSGVLRVEVFYVLERLLVVLLGIHLLLLLLGWHVIAFIRACLILWEPVDVKRGHAGGA